MTDDLVKRLWESDEASALTNQAARRIEELKAKLDLSEGALDVASKSWGECQRILKQTEAKLAKAVEALERIASGEFSGRMLTSMPPKDAAQYFARTTLAELKEADRG
jgi:exonuclease VII small subunit